MKKIIDCLIIIKTKFINGFLPSRNKDKIHTLIRISETFVIALLGGTVFFYLNTPLPWMLGALTSILLWNILLKGRTYWPSKYCYAGMLLVGYNIGRTFTQETAHQILIQLPLMIIATILTVLFSLFQGYMTYKKTGITLDTGLTGSTPGGLSQMVVLCEEMPNADVTVVTFMQTARQLGVVFLIPFLAVHALSNKNTAITVLSTINIQQHFSLKYLLFLSLFTIASGLVASFFKFPTPFLMGPVLGIAVLVLCGFTAPQPSKNWLSIAQVFIGAYMGMRIKLSDLNNWKKLLPHTIVNVVSLLAFSLVLAYALSYFYHIPVITAFLSTAPGGMAEMGLTAMNVHANVSIVVAFQLFRLLFVLLIVPPLIKKIVFRTA